MGRGEYKLQCRVQYIKTRKYFSIHGAGGRSEEALPSGDADDLCD